MLPSRSELGFLERAVDLPVLPLLLLCVCVAWKVTQGRQRRALHVAEARATAAAAAVAAAAGATSECFTTEWANQLLRAMWPSTLEPRVAAKVQEKVDVALLKVLKGRGQKGPLRYVERASVAHVSLGNAPPVLYTVRAQSSPADKLLRLDFGLEFAPAAGFRVVLALMVRPTKMLPALAVYVEVANVKLHGSCRLALTLAPDQAPGISNVAASFLRPPVFSFDFVPFGLPVGELPYVLDMLKDQLQAVLSAKMVEPNRISISIGQDAAAGQAPLQDVLDTAKEAVRVRRTTTEERPQPTVSVPARLSWMPWQRRASTTTAVQILATQPHATVTAVSERVLTEAQYKITDNLIFGLGEEDVSPLEASGNQGAVKQGLQPHSIGEIFDGAECGMKKSMQQHVVHVTAACTAVTADAAQQRSLAEDTHPTTECCTHSTSQTTDHMPRLPSTSDTELQEEPVLVADSLAGTDPCGRSNPESLAASELAADGDLSAEKEARLTACKALLADATANLEALRRRITAERLRALVEGAPFLVHAASRPKQQIVWYSQSDKVLYWADEKGDTSTAQTLHLAADSHVTAGAADFPQLAACEKGKVQTWPAVKLWRRNSKATPDPQRAMGEDARSLSVKSSNEMALLLELPRCGNGRSRREWMDAITDVIGASLNTVDVELSM